MEYETKKYFGCEVIKIDSSKFSMSPPDEDPMAEAIFDGMNEFDGLHKVEIINTNCAVVPGMIIYTIFYSYWAHL